MINHPYRRNGSLKVRRNRGAGNGCVQKIFRVHILVKCILVLGIGFFINLFFLHNQLSFLNFKKGNDIEKAIEKKAKNEIKQLIHAFDRGGAKKTDNIVDGQGDEREDSNFVSDVSIVSKIDAHSRMSRQLCGDESNYYNLLHENVATAKARKRKENREEKELHLNKPYARERLKHYNKVYSDYLFRLPHYGFSMSYTEYHSATATEARKKEKDKQKQREIEMQNTTNENEKKHSVAVISSSHHKNVYNECSLPKPSSTACDVKEYSIVVTSIGKNLRTLFVNIINWLLHDMVAEVYIILPNSEYDALVKSTKSSPTITSPTDKRNTTSVLENNNYFARKLLDWHNDPEHKTTITFDDSLWSALSDTDKFNPKSEAILFMDGDILWDGTYLNQIQNGFLKWKNHPHTILASEAILVQPNLDNDEKEQHKKKQKKLEHQNANNDYNNVSPMCLNNADNNKDGNKRTEHGVKIWDHSLNNIIIIHVPQLSGLFIHRDYLCFLNHPIIQALREDLETKKKKALLQHALRDDTQFITDPALTAPDYSFDTQNLEYLQQAQTALAIYFMQLSYHSPIIFKPEKDLEKGSKKAWGPQKILKKEFMMSKNINNIAGKKKQEDEVKYNSELEELLSSLFAYFGYIPKPSATSSFALYDNNPNINVCDKVEG